MIKKRFLSLLALLMTAVTGAWAQEQSETIATTAANWVEGLIVEGTHFTISNNGNDADADGMFAEYGITVTPKNGETITKVVISCTLYPENVNDGNTSVSSGTKKITNSGGTITVTGVNASTFTFTCSHDYPQFGQFVVYYTPAASTQATGYFDHCTAHHGSIFVDGWAFDPDQSSVSIQVHAYIWYDTPASGRHMPAVVINTDVARSDVNSAYGITGLHGFERYITVPAGTYTVEIYAIDITGDGNPKLPGYGNITVTVGDPYNITYDANGGSDAPDAQQKGENVQLTLSSTVPTRTGYTFAGWNTASDGSGTAYAAGATYTANADLTLYAQWTQNTATLTDGNDLSALSAWAGKTCTVTYTRSFTAGKPSTVCLPFAYTPQGEEKFYSFTGIKEDDGNYTAYMTEVVSPLVANTPYLFMPTGDADFSGTYAIPSTIAAGTTTSGDWTFIGTYSTINWTDAPTGIYGFSAQNVDEQGISQGQFVKVGEYVRVKPMRCYLQYGNGTSDWAGARGMTRAAAEPLPETIGVRLISANDEVTAIGTLHTRTGEVSFDSEAWYTLDGKRLSTQPNTKGIYVNNGKKVVIK